MTRRRAILGRAAILAATGLAAFAGLAAAATVGGGGGVEWFSGPGAQSTASTSAFASLSGRRASLALGGLLFDDHFVGRGHGALGALAVQPRDGWVVRAWSARHLGEGAFRAWRLKAGPELALPRETTLGFFYTYQENSFDGVARGAALEVATPVAPRIEARVTGAHQRAGDLRSSQGTVGVAWVPIAGLELGADVGLARNGAFLPVGGQPGGPGGSGGGLGLPPGLLPAAGRPSAPEAGGRFETAPTLGLGLRVALP